LRTKDLKIPNEEELEQIELEPCPNCGQKSDANGECECDRK